MQSGQEDQDVLIKVSRWKMGYTVGVLFVLYMMDYALRSVIGPMTPALKSSLGLSDTEIGWLMSVVLIGVAVFALPISFVIDRWRRAKMVSIIAIVWSIASIFSGFCVNFGQLLTTRAMVGIGEAGFVSGGLALIIGMVRKARRAFVTGIWTAAIPLGSAVGFLVGGWVTKSWGWQAAFLALAAPGVIFGILAWFLPDYKIHKDTLDKAGSGKTAMITTLKEMLRIKTLPILYISVALAMCLQQGLIPWVPVLLNRNMGMDNAVASTFSSGIALLAVISMPLGGWVADRVSRHNPRNKVLVMVAGLWLCGFFIAAGAYLGSLPLFVAGAFFIAFGVSAQLNTVQEIVPIYRRATAWGLYMFSGYFLGGMWGPIIMGAVSDAAGIQYAYIVICAIGIVGSLGLLWASRHFNADYQRARDVDRSMGLLEKSQ
ncbi:MAG: MFS transporter [Dehalococcoidia bacterium]|nr:MAG: MFS transporter [Dehalococcoidia bacterium]